MSSLHSLALGYDTSLPPVLTPQVDTQVILLPITLPTPLTFALRFSIPTQFTRHTYNFTSHNYATRDSGLELFLESHNLHHHYHLTENPPPLCDPSYASWLQSNSSIITWMLHSIEQSIVESLMRIKLTRSLKLTLETMYAN